MHSHYPHCCLTGRSTGPIAAGRHLGYKSLSQTPARRNRPVSLNVRHRAQQKCQSSTRLARGGSPHKSQTSSRATVCARNNSIQLQVPLQSARFSKVQFALQRRWRSSGFVWCRQSGSLRVAYAHCASQSLHRAAMPNHALNLTLCGGPISGPKAWPKIGPPQSSG